MTDLLLLLAGCLVAVVTVPVLTFLVVRAGTLGYLAARRRSEESDHQPS